MADDRQPMTGMTRRSCLVAGMRTAVVAFIALPVLGDAQDLPPPRLKSLAKQPPEAFAKVTRIRAFSPGWTPCCLAGGPAKVSGMAVSYDRRERGFQITVFYRRQPGSDSAVRLRIRIVGVADDTADETEVDLVADQTSVTWSTRRLAPQQRNIELSWTKG